MGAIRALEVHLLGSKFGLGGRAILRGPGFLPWLRLRDLAWSSGSGALHFGKMVMFILYEQLI